MFVLGNALRYLRLAFVCFLLIGIFPQNIQAGEDSTDDVPNRYGLATIIGNTYDPTGNIGFAFLSGFALFDYDKIWLHAAPAPLRFKVEASVGSTWTQKKEVMASAGMFALYFLDRVAGHGFRPYVEGGIGGRHQIFAAGKNKSSSIAAECSITHKHHY